MGVQRRVSLLLGLTKATLACGEISQLTLEDAFVFLPICFGQEFIVPFTLGILGWWKKGLLPCVRCVFYSSIFVGKITVLE